MEIRGSETPVLSKVKQWRLDAPPCASPMLEDHIEPLVSRLEGIAERLNRLPVGASREIDIAVCVTNPESIPGMYLECALIERIARLGLAVGLSIY